MEEGRSCVISERAIKKEIIRKWPTKFRKVPNRCSTLHCLNISRASPCESMPLSIPDGSVWPLAVGRPERLLWVPRLTHLEARCRLHRRDGFRGSSHSITSGSSLGHSRLIQKYLPVPRESALAKSRRWVTAKPRGDCPHRLARFRTPAFHAGNAGSNPAGDTRPHLSSYIS